MLKISFTYSGVVWVILALIGLSVCVFLPFFHFYNIFPVVQLGQTLFLQVLIGLFFLVLSLLGSKGICISSQMNIIDLLLFCIFNYIFLNSFVLQTNVVVSSRMYDLVGLGFFYSFIRIVGFSFDRWMIFIFFGGLIQSIYGQLQLHGVYPSLNLDFLITGSFFNPGPYAGYLSAIFPVSFGFFLFSDFWKISNSLRFWTFLRCLSLVTGLGILLILPVTASRAAGLAVASSVGFLYFHHFRLREKVTSLLCTRFKRIAGVSMIVFFILSVMISVYLLRSNSVDGRMLIWKVSSTRILDNPWIGTGLDGFQVVYMDAQASWFRNFPGDPAIQLADDVAFAYNEGIQLLVEQGFFGFLLGVILLFVVFQINGSGACPEIWLAQAGLLSIVVFGMFSYPSHILPIKVCGVLYLAILGRHSKKMIEHRRSFPFKVPSMAVRIFTLILTIGILWNVVRLHQGSKDWKMAFAYYQIGAFRSSLPWFAKAFHIFSRDGRFLVNYGKALSSFGDHKRAIEVLGEAKKYIGNSVLYITLGESYMALGMYDQAEEAYQLAADMLPDRFYPKYLLARFYYAIGDMDSMEPIARYLIGKEPKVSSDAVDEIKREMEVLLGENASTWGDIDPDL
ncbi:hypothetical protein ADIS_0418 [Lunatimonas lonarensis]|uniref:O-antigen ligase-related domain-containing protein n=1 Tax=Lunatimonas lonarensis TaxID=1232681 RepID=R7ZYG2_9BACT|nr:O-antigen ligase family protein [Lunatimonas lonarensis]EON79099.1 hypothetical protein ADIS_0418 [Lunatimonas lonarensis]